MLVSTDPASNLQDIFKTTVSNKPQAVKDVRNLYILNLDPEQAALEYKESVKAYAQYTISNDHRNRMVHNYIPAYSKEKYPLAFFTYIAGGFGKNIDSQIQSIVTETGVHGGAVDVSRMIALIEKQQKQQYNHMQLKNLFSLDRQASLLDL